MKKVLLRGPVLTRSGYGEHARFVLKALQQNEDYDIYVEPLNWGKSNWLHEDTESRREIDSFIYKMAQNPSNDYDISFQVTIPNEWVNAAPVNVGICAGVETDKISLAWLQKANEMDRIIVTSQHAKDGFVKTTYDLKPQGVDGDPMPYTCQTPVEVAHYGVGEVKPKPLALELDDEFNFLTVAQMGPRKNLENTIRWFYEEFENDQVGLVIKAHWLNNSLLDRRNLTRTLSSIKSQYPSAKCNTYLLHGNLTDAEMQGLYNNSKIKAYVTATHGEGFGLPIFEAASNGLPVVAPVWSGQADFLYAPVTNEKSGKTKSTLLCEKVAYDLAPVQSESVWQGVIEPGTNWCYPKQDKFKASMRSVFKAYASKKKNANTLMDYLKDEFSMENKLNNLTNLTTFEGEEK